MKPNFHIYYIALSVLTNLCELHKCRILFYTYTVLFINTSSDNITALSGQNVTLKCASSDDDIELYWTYQTVNTNGTVTSTNISQSKYLKESSLFHHLILPVATVNDTGLYTCTMREYQCCNAATSQVISLTVLPGNFKSAICEWILENVHS